MKDREIDAQPLSERPEDDAVDNAAPEKLSRKRRQVGPVVGMPCPPGYKQVGDDCVLANPEFK